MAGQAHSECDLFFAWNVNKDYYLTATFAFDSGMAPFNQMIYPSTALGRSSFLFCVCLYVCFYVCFMCALYVFYMFACTCFVLPKTQNMVQNKTKRFGCINGGWCYSVLALGKLGTFARKR